MKNGQANRLAYEFKFNIKYLDLTLALRSPPRGRIRLVAEVEIAPEKVDVH